MEKSESTKRRTRANSKLQEQFSISREEAIRRKAYDIWLRTHNPDAVANWLLAEKLLNEG
jgi:hypothetical protein